MCGRNRNRRFCNEIANEMMTDSDVTQCTSTRNCDSSECAAAINKVSINGPGPWHNVLVIIQPHARVGVALTGA